MIAEKENVAAALESRGPAKKQKPKAVWDGILYEFQVFYRAPLRQVTAEGMHIYDNVFGEVQSMLVRGKTQSQASWHLEQAGYRVTSIGTGKPVVDWSKPYFTRDEFQAMTGLGETATSELITSGRLKESSVKGLFSKKAIEDCLDSLA